MELVKRVIVIVIAVLIAWWLFKMALTFIIPFVLLAGGVYIWYKYFRSKN